MSQRYYIYLCLVYLVYQKSTQFSLLSFPPSFDATQSAAARMLVFHPILKCFRSLEFSIPNKPQSCNVSLIISRELLFPEPPSHRCSFGHADFASNGSYSYSFLLVSHHFPLSIVFFFSFQIMLIIERSSLFRFFEITIILVARNRFQRVGVYARVHQLIILIAPFPSLVISHSIYLRL